MPSPTKAANCKSKSRSDDHLYLVFKVDRDHGEMRELSKKAHPASGEEVFDLSTRDSRNEITVNTSGPRRNVARHPMPCGECSAAKTKCVPVPSEPSLCERCKKKDRSVCPPHIPWSHRKIQSTRSLSEGLPSQSSSHQSSPSFGQTEATTLPAPLPVSHHPERYPVIPEGAPYGQVQGGSLFHLSASQPPDFPVDPYFTGPGLETSCATYPQTEPLWFSNFQQASTSEHAEIPLIIYQEPAHYQQHEEGYWYGPSSYHQ